MSSQRTLKSLEIILESFLTRAVGLKEPRLNVLEGMNRLDDLARAAESGQDVSDEVADWIAQRRMPSTKDRFRPGDVSRIRDMLGTISTSIRESGNASPAHKKVAAAVESWRSGKADAEPLILKRPAEGRTSAESSIEQFAKALQGITRLYENSAHGRDHLLTVLDDNLTRARVHKSREALLLSALIIYYLRQRNYKVSPYVKRLKEAEKTLKEVR